MEDNIDLNKVDILMLLSDVNYKMKAGLNDSLSMTDSKMSDVSSND